jgi:hypothetical protein
MSSKSAYFAGEQPADAIQPYRTISRSAVLSLVFSLLSAAGLLFPLMLILAAGGLLFGVMAMISIRRYSDELSGVVPAGMGIALGAIMLIGGTSWHAFVYATEVPEGYQRISFYQLQPDDLHPELPVPPLALDLDGKQIFVKGYVHPGVSGQGPVKTFVLVPDMGTCCFGGQPKLNDMIEVTMRDPLRIRYTQTKRRLAGTLTVDTALKPVSGLNGVYYQLDADYVK